MPEEDRTCCLCNEPLTEYHELFDANDMSNSVYDIVEAYFPEEMLRHKIPLVNNYICSKCWNTIIDFHKFRRIIYDLHDGSDLKSNCEFLKNTEDHTTEEHAPQNFVYLNEEDSITDDKIYSDCPSTSTEKSTNQIQSVKVSEAEQGNTSPSDYICPQCSRQFALEKELRSHIRKTHVTGTTCEHCGDIMPTKYFVQKHAVMHGLIEKISKSHKCDICNEVFMKKYSLTNHMKSKHYRTTEYTCDECGKVVYSKQGLICHKRNEHRLTEANFKCVLCAKAYRYARDLTLHKLTHNKEKLFKCPYCDKRFSCPTSMFNHRRRFHLEEHEKHRKSAPSVKVDGRNVAHPVVI